MTPTQLKQQRRRLSAALGRRRLLPQWELGRMLCVNVRTIRRWEKGEFPIPDGVEEELARLIDEAEEK